jgi:uridine kinase
MLAKMPEKLALRSFGASEVHLQAPPLLIGVAGGTASGKTTVCRKIEESMGGDDRVAIISMDNFYRPLTQEERANVDSKNSCLEQLTRRWLVGPALPCTRDSHTMLLAGFDFDHPDAFDIPEIARCLDNLKKGKETPIPVYDFTTHSRSDKVVAVKPAEVIMFEGILVLHIPQILKRLNMKVPPGVWDLFTRRSACHFSCPSSSESNKCAADICRHR